MLEAIGNKVVYLKRLKMGDFELGDLEKGEYKIID
jgi:16S rRNA U516 pseudouridylate synthase RsuA-like enzyme